MPLQALLDTDHQSFGPDEIAKIVAGFEAALTALHLARRQDPATLLVAKTVLEAAKHGELDPQRLCDFAVQALSLQSSRPILIGA